MEPPYVYAMDNLAVDAFNAHARDEHRIHTDVLPEPFLGRKDAPIVLLNLNPGFDERANLTTTIPMPVPRGGRTPVTSRSPTPSTFLIRRSPMRGSTLVDAQSEGVVADCRGAHGR
jgi:hypothetical protein